MQDECTIPLVYYECAGLLNRVFDTWSRIVLGSISTLVASAYSPQNVPSSAAWK